MSDFIKPWWSGVEYNDAAKLGVTIERAKEPGTNHARCVAVHVLNGVENHDMHNVFFEFLDKNDNRIKLSSVAGENNGIKLFASLDKPDNEFGTNFVLHSADTLDVWAWGVPGQRVTSDIVHDLSSRWGGSLVDGQNWGHVSYLIIFKLGVEVAPEEPDPTPDDSAEAFEAGYKAGYTDGFADLKQKVLTAINGN